jgi:hypothetical protein
MGEQVIYKKKAYVPKQEMEVQMWAAAVEEETLEVRRASQVARTRNNAWKALE